jgi:hypothetical protein
LALICHREECVEKSYEQLIAAAQRDSRFAKRAAESVNRVQAFKKKSAAFLRVAKLPSATAVEKLSRNLWEFSEQVRLEAMAGTQAAARK